MKINIKDELIYKVEEFYACINTKEVTEMINSLIEYTILKEEMEEKYFEEEDLL